jgi:molybdopterin-guanine dinucleotide biosynthesis protein A
MGRDKALIHIGGDAMATRVARALSAGGCRPVVAVGGDAAPLAALGLTVVADRFPGEGPLGGVITALEQFREAQAVVVAACDLPHLTAATVESLTRALAADGRAAVAVAAVGGRQALCAAWRPSAAAALAAEFVGGERRLGEAVGRLRVVEVTVPASELVNVNTPTDLRQ